MESIIQEKNLLSPDIRLVTNLVCEIALIRRHVRTYPKNHIITLNALKRTSLLIDRLFEDCDSFNMGIARDGIVIDGGALESKNPVLADFARTLFSHGIASVTFSKGLTDQDLLAFIELTATRTEFEPGRFRREMNAAGITCIETSEIDYRQFRVTEEEEVTLAAEGDESADSLWQRFIKQLLKGNLDPDFSVGETSPEALAGMFNSMLGANPGLFRISDYEYVIHSFIRRLEDEALDSVQRDNAIDQLVAFIGNLAPEIRPLFLNSTFSMLSTDNFFAEQIMNRFPDEIIAEIMENILSGKSSTPPVVLKLMKKYTEKLMANRGDQLFPSEIDNVGRSLNAWMNPVFCEDEFVVAEMPHYSIDLLNEASSISDMGRAEIEELKKEIAGNPLERKLTEILQELIDTELEKNEYESLAGHLIEQCRYFLEIGDFEPLCHAYERLIQQDREIPNETSGAKHRMLGFFQSSEFVNEVLDAIIMWGKAKHGEIQQLILLVGTPFVKPMLDRMAEEGTMPIRRYYLDRLQELGKIAIGDVLERLNDSRWYCTRNMLVILRASNDSSILPEIYKLREHQHPKVRFELIRTLQSFNDPEADRLLLKDLQGGSPGLQSNAVALARYSSSSEILQALIKILEKPGFSGSELDLKISVIQTLAVFGSPDCIPVLKRLLQFKHLLYMSALTRIKQEIIRSLARYPSELAAPLLLGIIKQGGSDLSLPAQESLNSLGGRQ